MVIRTAHWLRITTKPSCPWPVGSASSRNRTTSQACCESPPYRETLQVNQNDDIAFDDLHPLTQQILTRRGFLGTAGKAAVGVSFLGIGMNVIGCAKEETVPAAGTTTVKPTAGSSTTTKAAPTTAKAPGTTVGSTPGSGATKTLYQELGGNAAITAVVGAFLTNVLADDVIKAKFAATDGADLGKKLVDQIGEATGGPEKYTGLDMKTAHKGMNITVIEFNAMVGDLGKALDQYKVPKDTQNKLVGALGGMQGDIVGQ